ncbi:hypothetical protein [Streptomyces virginiae]|uniref:hypothetical protein n=1 Tax=Streptomyces virginiae TaxID=1961 RepID=UPI0037021C75
MDFWGGSAVGAFVFLPGTIVNEFVLADERPALSQAVSLVAFSLLLSFGIGLVRGGIQHFEQFPERSAWMTPIGLLMSYVTFVAKDSKGRWRHLVTPFAGGVVALAVLAWLGMTALAGNISSGGGHDHGSTTGTPAKPDQKLVEQAPPAKAPAEPAEDGHRPTTTDPGPAGTS